MPLSMSTSSATFEGEYHFKLDPKCRVSIPADWCPHPDRVLRLLRSETDGVKVIKVLTQEEMDRMVEAVEEDDEFTFAQKRSYIGKLYARCLKTSTNKQNKLLIPQSVIEWPGLSAGADISLIGRKGYFELYATKNYLIDDAEDEDTQRMNEKFGFFG